MTSTPVNRRPLLARLGRPVRALEHDVEDLHRTEHEGVNAATPFIALLGLVLFFATAFALISAVALIAYYLAR